MIHIIFLILFLFSTINIFAVDTFYVLSLHKTENNHFLSHVHANVRSNLRNAPSKNIPDLFS